MRIIRIDETTAEKVSPLIADFRVTLQSYKGIRAKPDPGKGISCIRRRTGRGTGRLYCLQD